MLNQKEKERFDSLEEIADDLRMDKFRINNEKLIVERELQEVRKQLGDFKELVNHLTSKRVVIKRGEEITESFIGFLSSQGFRGFNG